MKRTLSSKRCLIRPVALIALMIFTGCDDGEDDVDGTDSSSDTSGDDDAGDGGGDGDSEDTDDSTDTSVCAGNTEVRSEDGALITDFDTIVTENWVADDTVGELVDDGESTVFHWATGDADSTTLVWPSAMVNSENEALCTDASAFTGIQLDIKGSVSTTGVDYWGGDWTDTISVNVVTAATYEVAWGGDALANCGNYFWAVSLASDWQTVTLDFDNVEEPWNLAACPDVTSLPIEKIMGIGLSIDSTYTDFEIYVDNITFL